VKGREGTVLGEATLPALAPTSFPSSGDTSLSGYVRIMADANERLGSLLCQRLGLKR
jgi:hypothetical protein